MEPLKGGVIIYDTARFGAEYAGEDAKLLYRFRLLER